MEAFTAIECARSLSDSRSIARAGTARLGVLAFQKSQCFGASIFLLLALVVAWWRPSIWQNYTTGLHRAGPSCLSTIDACRAMCGDCALIHPRPGKPLAAFASQSRTPAIASLARIEKVVEQVWRLERNEIGAIIGSKEISDSPMSGLKEDIMAKKKTAKKKTTK